MKKPLNFCEKSITNLSIRQKLKCLEIGVRAILKQPTKHLNTTLTYNEQLFLHFKKAHLKPNSKNNIFTNCRNYLLAKKPTPRVGSDIQFSQYLLSRKKDHKPPKTHNLK